MTGTAVLKKQVKKFIDNASEKELRMIYNIFELNKQDDWWNEISKEQQKAIDESSAEANQGKIIPHADMVKKYRK